MCLLNALNSIVYYYCLIFIGMYYISTYTHIFQKPFYRTVHCCAFHHPYLFTYYRYTKYLYPYEYEMKRLSTPSELRAAIDGNKHSSLGYVLTYIESPKGKDQGIISKKGLIIIWIQIFFSFMKILLHFLAALLKEFLVQFLWTFNMCQYVLETALTSRIEPIHIIPLYDSIF